MPRKTIFRAICAASRYIDGPELTWAHSGPQRWIWTLREKVRENSSGHVGGCRFRVYRVIEPLRTRCAWSCHLTRSWEREGEFLAPSLWFARCVTGCNSRSGVLECLGGDVLTARHKNSKLAADGCDSCFAVARMLWSSISALKRAYSHLPTRPEWCDPGSRR